MSVLGDFKSLQTQMETQIIGQAHLVESMLICLLSDGHLIVEGPPGLAKTKAIKTLAGLIEANFHRIQFTPDLLPSDITGTEIYRPQTTSFAFKKGPIFHNLVLADEINRAPAKVQSALLEAMAERQVSVGSQSYALPNLFMVMATQNPLEQEGTYPLPEAQLDRFLMHLIVGYPDIDSERKILTLIREENLREAMQPQDIQQQHIQKQHIQPQLGEQKAQQRVTKQATATDVTPLPMSKIFTARLEAQETFMAPAIETYLLELINATRFPKQYDAKLKDWIDFGVSPRGTLALDRVVRTRAWLNERDFVTPEDVQAMLPLVMRHRIGLNFSASAEGVSTGKVLGHLLNTVAAP